MFELRYLVEGSVSKDLDQVFVVRDNDQSVAPLVEVLTLLEPPCDCERLPFDSCVALLSGRKKSWARQRDAPTLFAAARCVGRAAAVLLEKEVADFPTRSVRMQTCLALMMASLDAWNASARSEDYENLHRELRKGLDKVRASRS